MNESEGRNTLGGGMPAAVPVALGEVGYAGAEDVSALNKAPSSLALSKFDWSLEDMSSPARYMIVSDEDLNGGEVVSKVFEAMKGSADWESLTSPGIVVSITGEVSDFELSFRSKELILRELVDSIKHLKPLIVTGGTHNGIMRLVGEARAQYQTDINLLGIAPYAVVEEGEVLLQVPARDWNASGVGFGKAVYNRFQASEPYPEATSKLEKKSLLDRNHSHFILVESLNAEDKAKPWKHRYGEETIFRTRLEMHIKRGPDVPILLVCVQGGPGSVKAVLDAAKQGKSCLLVNGSGRAADLMSDAVKLCLPVGHADHIKRGDFDQRQKAMCEYFERSYGIRYESDAWSLVARVGQEPQHSIEENTSWDRFWKMYDMVVTQPKLIHELFTLANSGKCWIFDLNIEHRKGEFKESMLQCLLAEVEQELQIDVGVGDSNRLRSALERKLDLAIKFQSPSDVSNIIKNAWKDMKLKHYIPELVEDSLISALQASTVSVVEVLLQEVPYLEFLMITVKTLVLAFSDQYTEHDSKQAAQARRSLRLVNSVIPKRKIAKLEEPATSAIREGAQRKKDYQQWPLLDGTHPTDISMFQNIRHRSYPAVEDIISELLEKQQDLEVEFRLHCHPSFTYQLGADGPFADLFLSSILFLKLDLADLIWRYWIPDVNKAEVFWTESINPIVYAITAAFYLRRLSKKERNASKKEHLVSRADAFEGSAVKVYQKAVANERADQSVWGSASVSTRVCCATFSVIATSAAGCECAN
eukprot:764932-Hanusia_phi.AAC.1